MGEPLQSHFRYCCQWHKLCWLQVHSSTPHLRGVPPRPAGAGASTLGVLNGRQGEGEPSVEPIGPAGYKGLSGEVSGFDSRGTEGEAVLQRVGPGAGRPKLAEAGRRAWRSTQNSLKVGGW